MFKIRFFLGDSTNAIEEIESNIIPRKDDGISLKSGNFKVLAVVINYITNEVLVCV